MRSVGICMGASNIKLLKLSDEGSHPAVLDSLSRPHEGEVKGTLRELLAREEFSDCDRYAVTGRKFKSLVDLPTISEPEATELAYDFTTDPSGEVEAIVSAGGETFMVYELNEHGNIVDVYTGNKCASGTGEFYFQQLKRMGVEPDETERIAQLDDPYEVSGRCSVFCKSDCTHALNKGEAKGRIVAGLSKMMVGKICEQLSKCAADEIMVVGGTTRNNVMLAELQKHVERFVVPDESVYFEPLGAALWGLENGEDVRSTCLFRPNQSSFDYLEPLSDYEDQVKFHQIDRSAPEPGDRCILGVDVGSTTTKAVLIREADESLVDSVYLRTEGDPVAAARECYSRLADRLEENQIEIVGLGVTGSGRHIVGLHALTDSVVNEIIAHARASVHFDSEVDTIFEIGGQDAKYTYLVNGVPTDYAMNEACAAGTGSFLEESAFETLDVEMEDIAGHALAGESPPNFSDQCSAFISSDIKTAIQEGLEVDDICAGLVYSVCRNYTNRVKESRPVGDKIFMQGGVCYNRAVPMAMAALTGKEIIVPPEPGLMGAFGVALVVAENLELGLTEENEFDLGELAERQVKYREPFVCQGGAEDCDRKCEINVLEIDGEKHPFGGICNKYYNRAGESDYDVRELDLVHRREEMLFDDYFYRPADPEPAARRIGLNRSLAVNTLLPMYSRFFGELGHEVVLPDKPTETGMQRPSAAFCYPIEISHGFMHDLLENHEVDRIFLPQVKGMPVEGDQDRSVLCPLSQGEPYYLQATWPELEGADVFSPVLDFQDGYDAASEEFVEVGKKLGHSAEESRQAFRRAVNFQRDFRRACRREGREVLSELEQEPDRKAVVIFGRSYNALTSVANMGIPHKFASRGELVIPFDMLPLESEETETNMYWAFGQQILRGAKYVTDHPQLFGTFITNFSCGPDSFLISYFRRVSGRKPTLTLELDSHTADAGVDTRIDAFLDVVDSYRKLEEGSLETGDRDYRPARVEKDDGHMVVYDSSGEKLPLSDERVTLLIPSMGRTVAGAFASALQYCGFSARVCDSPGKPELKAGKANCTGKECLPLQLTLGSLVRHIDEREPGEIIVYFMPRSVGPCRFGQYNVFMRNFIRDNEVEDVALLSLSDENNYAGLGTRFTLRAWQSVVIGDVLLDIYSTVRTLAVAREQALAQFEKSRKRIFDSLAGDSWFKVKSQLADEAERLAEIELECPPSEAPTVGLVGEIYVRCDEFSRQGLVDRLAGRGIVTRVAPAHEWLYYLDYLVQEDLVPDGGNIFGKLKNRFTLAVKKHLEKSIKKTLGASGLVDFHETDVPEVVEASESVLSPELEGEAVLTIGGAVKDIVDRVDGVIALGPFGCMPHRLSESILSEALKKQKQRIEPDDHPVHDVLDQLSLLPFLAVETDGNVFSQEVESRLEAFCLQVQRVNDYRRDERVKFYEDRNLPGKVISAPEEG